MEENRIGVGEPEAERWGREKGDKGDKGGWLGEEGRKVRRLDRKTDRREGRLSMKLIPERGGRYDIGNLTR